MATDLTETDKIVAQQKPGLFRRFRIGSVLKCMNLFHDLSLVYDILEFVRGAGNIKIRKNGSKAWVIECSGCDWTTQDPPSGWEEETVNIVTDEGIITRTVLVKSDDSTDVETWDSGDVRLILQVNSSGKLTLDRVYFKS